MKDIITVTFCCDNPRKSKFMAPEKPRNSGNFCYLTLWPPCMLCLAVLCVVCYQRGLLRSSSAANQLPVYKLQLSAIQCIGMQSQTFELHFQLYNGRDFKAIRYCECSVLFKYFLNVTLYSVVLCFSVVSALLQFSVEITAETVCL